MVKVCTKCKVEKPFTEFSKDKRKKYGLRSDCKFCGKEYRQANKEKINQKSKEYYQSNKEYRKEYHQTNKEKIREYQKQYHQANKEKRKEYIKQYNQSNKEKIKEYIKEYRKANKEKIKEYKKEHYQSNKDNIREKRKEYQRERIKTDSLFKMKRNLRKRTWEAFKNKGYKKTSKTQEMLGVDWEVAKQHIEIQFTKGMNWDNQGEWHIDHIIPLASANTEEEIKKLCYYTNLQPMWAEDNLSKSDKIIEQQTLLRI